MTVSISLGISAAAFLVSAIAVVFAYQQLGQAKIANAFPVVLDLLDDFTKTRAERYFILTDLSRFEPSSGVWGLPDAEREKVLRVLHYLDHLGLLVDQKLADEEVIGSFIGVAIISLWQSLEPYVRAERAKRLRDRGGPDVQYQLYFEDLAVRMSKLDLPKIRKHLRAFPDRG
jgi:hypothetical protein